MITTAVHPPPHVSALKRIPLIGRPRLARPPLPVRIAEVKDLINAGSDETRRPAATRRRY